MLKSGGIYEKVSYKQRSQFLSKGQDFYYPATCLPAFPCSSLLIYLSFIFLYATSSWTSPDSCSFFVSSLCLGKFVMCHILLDRELFIKVWFPLEVSIALLYIAYSWLSSFKTCFFSIIHDETGPGCLMRDPTFMQQ